LKTLPDIPERISGGHKHYQQISKRKRPEEAMRAQERLMQAKKGKREGRPSLPADFPTTGTTTGMVRKRNRNYETADGVD